MSAGPVNPAPGAGIGLAGQNIENEAETPASVDAASRRSVTPEPAAVSRLAATDVADQPRTSWPPDETVVQLPRRGRMHDMDMSTMALLIAKTISMRENIRRQTPDGPRAEIENQPDESALAVPESPSGPPPVFGALPNEEEMTECRATWHTSSVDYVASRLMVNTKVGLTSTEAQTRLEVLGKNILTGASQKANAIVLFLTNLFSFLSILLMVAMVLSFVTAAYPEGGVLAFIILFNALVGFVQEYRSERTLEALQKLTAARCTVVRDGKLRSIDATTVVIGDVVVLNMGDAVPADCRIIEAVKLEVDESTLTGESVPARKRSATMSAQLGGAVISLGDRANMTYSGCFVAQGKGRGIVVATGNRTELGQIAKGVTKTEKKGGSYLGREVRNLSIVLFSLGVVFAVVVFAANSFVYSQETLIYAITLIIAVIPESLPLMLTVSMAMGMRRMAEHNAVVRRIGVLETLGRVTDICSDKTGTLTQGKMSVVNIWQPHRTYAVTGTAFSDTGEFVVDGQAVEPDGATDLLLQCCTLCNDARLVPPGGELVTATPGGGIVMGTPLGTPVRSGSVAAIPLTPIAATAAPTTATAATAVAGAAPADGVPAAPAAPAADTSTWRGVGTPTEIALAFLALKRGFTKPTMIATSSYKVAAEWPFDSNAKTMTVVYKDVRSNSHIAFMKGAPERVLRICSRIQNGDQIIPPPPTFTEDMQFAMNQMTSRGQRVIACAYRPAFPFRASQNVPREAVDTDMVFLGLVGIWDPPRPESLEAVASCQTAGITVHMLTGDHPATAAAIAADIGITHHESDPYVVMTATEFEALSTEQVDALVELPKVIARCAPDTKVRMLKSLHRRERIAAMTGDGVNDAPSLKTADVGICMGSGSEVTKQAADLVLTNDNFTTIVAAIREGRRIFTNIKKFVVHEISSNIASLLVLVVSLAFRDPSNTAINPLSALQTVWINTLIVSLPSLALAREPDDPELMNRPPDFARRGVFSPEVRLDVVTYGMLIGAFTLGAFAFVLYGIYGGPIAAGCNDAYRPECETVFRARATAFATLALLLLFNAFDCRDSRKYLWSMSVFANKYLIGAFLICASTIVAWIYIPFVNTVLLAHSPISWEWGVTAVCIVAFELIVQLYKLIKNLVRPLPSVQAMALVPQLPQ